MTELNKITPVVAVVDDDAALREALASLLKAAGFKVRTFASAYQYLESEYYESADCLILDVQLPGMTGLELQRGMAASRVGVPIVFLTAVDDFAGQLQRQALHAGAVAFLRKPVNEELLLRAVRSACTR